MRVLSSLFVLLFLLSLEKFNQHICIQTSYYSFDSIEFNVPLQMKLSPENEYCYVYKLDKDVDHKIGISFINGVTKTSEVTIYKSYSDITKEGNKYIKGIDNYILGEKPFKEIKIEKEKKMTQIIIIIREQKYHFTDYILLYDSEKSFNLNPGVPLSVKNFLSNDKYSIKLNTLNKNKIIVLYSSKTRGNIIAINPKKFGTYSSQEESCIYENNDVDEIEIQKKTDNQEFNIIFYEDIDNFRKLELGKNIQINYLNFPNNNRTKFKFYADISQLKNINSINFKLDYKTKKDKYITIKAEMIGASNELQFQKNRYINDKLKFEYDLYSDEYIKYYFNPQESNERYKYILVQVDINSNSYTIPKHFSISISNVSENVNLDNANYMQIQKYSKSYIPIYLHFSLNKETKYLLNSPYKDEILLIKGKLLKNNNLGNEDVLNKDIIQENTDLYEINGLSELTIRIFGYQTNSTFLIEKSPANLVIFNESERTEKPILKKFSDNECKMNDFNYIIIKYDINYFSNGNSPLNKYWTTDNEENINVYYKNNSNLYSKSLFAYDKKYELEKDTEFVSNSHVDIFSIKCSSSVNFQIRPIKKTYKEKTIELNFDKKSNFNIPAQEKQIIQPTYSLKNRPKSIYISLLKSKKIEMDITPEQKLLFEKQMHNEVLSLFEIKTSKYKMDEMGFFIKPVENISIEVTQTSDLEIHQYQNIHNNNGIFSLSKNNFIIFLDEENQDLHININNLKDVNVGYGIVKLATNDTKYIPWAFSLEGTKTEKLNKVIEIKNIENIKVDKYKPYKAFVFSIKSDKTIYNYKIEYKMNVNKIKIFNILLISSLSVSILIIIALLIYIITRSPKKTLDLDYANESLIN